MSSKNTIEEKPEFSIQVKTRFEQDVELLAFNVGNGFVLENRYITPVLCQNTSELPKAIDNAIEKLNNSIILEAEVAMS